MGALKNASIVSLLTALVSAAPLVLGVLFAFRPTDRRLALMRPLSLAAIFAALSNTMLGLVNTLVYVSTRPAPVSTTILTGQLAETLVLPFLSFGCLTAAWLAIAVGMRRQP